MVGEQSFNSLQTGKRIQSRFEDFEEKSCGASVSIPFKRESGSKVIGNFGLIWVLPVSIPFKRESGSKAEQRSLKTESP